MSMVYAMIEAAREARKAEYDRPSGMGMPQTGDLIRRRVDILITEIGLLVVGESRGEGFKVGKSIEIDWEEFYGNPALLANAVRLVEQGLVESEKGWKA